MSLSLLSRFACISRSLSGIVVQSPSGFSRPHRIVVGGLTCAGKSTLATDLSAKYDLEHIEMDDLFWSADWTKNSEFENEVSSILEECIENDRGWVIEGVDYSRHGVDVKSLIFQPSTTFIHVEVKAPILFWRLLKRTLRRVIWREDVCGGNRETFRKQFLSTDSVFFYLWGDIKNDHLNDFFEDGYLEELGLGHLNLIKIRNSREMRMFREANLFGDE